MNENTHMRITRTYLAKLHKLCEASKRKPAAEIEWLIDQALFNGTQTIPASRVRTGQPGRGTPV